MTTTSEKVRTWLEYNDLAVAYGVPGDGYMAVARRFDADYCHGVRYRLDFFRGDRMPMHGCSEWFHSTTEIEQAMRAVEPDLRRWRILREG